MQVEYPNKNLASQTANGVLAAPEVTRRENELLVTWKELDGGVEDVAHYIVRRRIQGDQEFRDSFPLPSTERQYAILDIREDEAYEIQVVQSPFFYLLQLLQVVAVVRRPVEGTSDFEKWITSPLTDIDRGAYETTAKTNKSFPGKESTTSTITKGTKLNIQERANPDHGNIQCGSDENAIKAMEEKGCLRGNPFDFVFGDGDCIFITIFASLFSVVGVNLNLLVFVAVINYRPTRRHVSIRFFNFSLTSHPGHHPLHPLHHPL